MIRVADYIMSKIEKQGVNHVFYVPGGQCVYLTDALRRAENIEGISVHHEQAAAMAALSYSLYNDNFGACLVTTGCAGTNTVTGVLHAWQDSIPCIFISGQQNYEQTIAYSGLPLRQVGVQEADIVSIVKPITKYAVMLTNPEDVAFELEKAIHIATTGRKGPVWIDVPLNIQNAMIDEENVKHYEAEESKPLSLSAEDEAFVLKSIEEAKRPVLFAGQGIRSAGAIEELKRFAEKTRIPVVFTRYSTDMMEYESEYNYGIVCSVGANRYANFIIQNADLVLNVGCRLSIDTTGPEQDKFAREAKVIAVDIDEVEHRKKGVKIDKFVHADAKLFFEKMLTDNVKVTDQWWIDKCTHWKEIFKPDWTEAEKQDLLDIKYFYEKLSEKLPDNSVVLSDAGMTGAAVSANCHLRKGSRLLHAYAQGEMGYVLPGSLGAACASDGMIFAITGDGSFMMNLQELQTVVRNQFNIKIIINNNNGYSGVRHGQKAHFRGKSIGTDPSNGIDFPDFGKVAEAFGIPYCKIECTNQLEEKLEKMLSVEGPFICEVMCDPEQFDLHNALVMYGKRKFGFRPIEDQSPFIDREVFFEEMIVEPMETSYGKPM